ncbi:hypothetical protein ANCCEY_05307 [Ancylostoma ceylanicum]|uniref:Uncharacterized protein n=1 Tax=Ancylostoma ceylanicum TaxID=53326 RepID=A0A0D6LWP4_9BILA|nr:hypothetical protein ANCCEY_05307 [Ancylostoma ceylanicum]
MFFVYFKIYQAFAKHRARQIYRQKVIRKHIESTILHEISHVLPVPDGFDKDEEEDSDSSDRVENGLVAENVPILQQCDDKSTTVQEVNRPTPLHLSRSLSQGKSTENRVNVNMKRRHEMMERRKTRKANPRKSLRSKPKAISAAKERRGVKVLGIILGCFTVFNRDYQIALKRLFTSAAKPAPLRTG